MLVATHGNRVIVACVFGHVIVAADDCSVILSDCLIATKCQVAIGLVLNRVATGCLCGIGSHDVSVANHDGIFTANVSTEDHATVGSERSEENTSELQSRGALVC